MKQTVQIQACKRFHRRSQVISVLTFNKVVSIAGHRSYCSIGLFWYLVHETECAHVI